MISHQHRCVFVHIPKNAGQSIEHVFLKWLGLSWDDRAPLLLRPNDDPAQGPPRLAHLQARQYVSCGHLKPGEFAEYYKFSFVRNPWDRMLSIYKYLAEPREQNFTEFLQGQFRNDLWKSKYWFVGPQYEFVCDSDGKPIVDFVGRFESLQADFNQVCRRLGMPETPVPHVNKSGQHGGFVGAASRWIVAKLPAKPKNPLAYVERYDEPSAELVRRLYQRDIELFGYEFGQPAPAGPVHAAV